MKIPVPFFKKIKIYYKAISVVKRNSSGKVEVDIDKKYKRDLDLEKILK
jgi:hypothetical protein